MRPREVRRWLVAGCLFGSLISCTSNGSGNQDAGKLDVVASMYPVQFVVQRVAGDRASVENLTPPGAEPHDLELTPRQVAAVRGADLVVLVRHVAPAVDDATEGRSDQVLDLAGVQPLAQGYEAIEEGATSGERTEDPHVWLDPVRMQGLVEAVSARLGQVDETNRAGYTERAAVLVRQLKDLDAEFRTGLASCARNELVTSHNAFGYLARRYALTQVGILGLTPEEEPRPARLAAVARYARSHGVTTIFFESLVSPKVARTIAAEVGATTAVLDPIESQAAGGDYFSAMRANLVAIRKALGCR